MNKRVLVVDDDEFNLRVSRGLLKLMDIEAETADSGCKAIELVKQNDYDIIFIDHIMPEMDGIETAREIRKIRGEDLTIVALTGDTDNSDIFLCNGFDGFLAKPATPDNLRMILEKYSTRNKTGAGQQEHHPLAGMDDELRRKASVTFAKENADIAKRIVFLISTGDIKTAHRMAHNLKSSSGYLNFNGLSAAAASLEHSLQCEPPTYTDDQFRSLKRELDEALRELEPLLKAVAAERTEAACVSAEELGALLSELRPLLEQDDFGASGYVKRLEGIKGTEELAKLIDDYDFEGALEFLDSLQSN
jgi:CheY-like chemotaxis protein